MERFIEFKNEVVKFCEKKFEISKKEYELRKHENQVKNLYQRIGEYVYRNRSGIEEPKLVEIINLINEDNTKMFEISKEIGRLSGSKACPVCNKIVGQTATFCCKCGSKL